MMTSIPLLQPTARAVHAPAACRITADAGTPWRLADGTPVRVRPVGPRDRAALGRFAAALSPASRLARYGTTAMGLSDARLAALTDIDPEHEVGFVITVPDEGGERIVGELRFVIDGSSGCADVALVVADGWHRHGIGTRALLALVRAAARRGLRWLRADVGCANDATLRMLQHCGFTATPHPDDAALTQLHLLLVPPFPGQ
jgi:acetyltransferase